MRAWTVREAFLRIQLASLREGALKVAEPKIAPQRRRDRDEYAFSVQHKFNQVRHPMLQPALALVRLRHAFHAPAEVAKRRREAAALAIGTRARGKRAREEAKKRREQMQAEARKARKAEAEVQRVVTRNQRTFHGIVQRMVWASERDDRRRATQQATAFIRQALRKRRKAARDEQAIHKRLQTAKRQAFTSMLRRLVARCERDDHSRTRRKRENATRRATAFFRRRKREREQEDTIRWAQCDECDQWCELEEDEETPGRRAEWHCAECRAAQALVGLRAGRRGKRLKKNATTKPGAHEKKTQPNKRERAGQGDHAHKDERGAEATSTRQKCNTCGQALAYHRGWRSATEGNLWCDAPGCGCVITPRDARFSCAACDHDICSVCGVEAEGEGVANYRTRRGWGNWEGEHGHVTIF